MCCKGEQTRTREADVFPACWLGPGPTSVTDIERINQQTEVLHLTPPWFPLTAFPPFSPAFSLFVLSLPFKYVIIFTNTDDGKCALVVRGWHVSATPWCCHWVVTAAPSGSTSTLCSWWHSGSEEISDLLNFYCWSVLRLI